MSSSTQSGTSSGRKAFAVVFAVIALVFIVVGIIYVAVAAGSLPGFMGHISGSTGHHPLRAAGALIVGVVFAVGAWFALKYQSGSSNSAGAERKETASR